MENQFKTAIESAEKLAQLLNGDVFSIKTDSSQETLQLKCDNQGNMYIYSQNYSETRFEKVASVLSINSDVMKVSFERIGYSSVFEIDLDFVDVL